ncbi:hypothetical protein BGX29_003328, partial [Mortierella sp. GBA35]
HSPSVADLKDGSKDESKPFSIKVPSTDTADNRKELIKTEKPFISRASMQMSAHFGKSRSLLTRERRSYSRY